MSKHYAIKCTNCAAPLDILGGGRVSTVTCSYCHSMLDMNDHYKVLTKFNNAKDALGDFQIGMRGNIKGVEWTIIGWIAYRTAEFPAEEWNEFFLYSPTHGYAWLIEENNKLYFSKKVRDFDLLTWQEKKPKTLFYHKGHYLQKEASYLTYIDYVEGELNWVAKFGDKFTTWDYEGVGFQVLNIEKTGEEIEVYHTQRLKKPDIYTAFGLPHTEENKIRYHKEDDGVEVEEIEDNTSSKKGWFILFFILILMTVLSFFSSEIITFDTKKGNNKHSFNITSNSYLTHISIDSINYLDNTNLTLYKENKKIFYIDKVTVYYVKKHLYHNWSDRSTHTDIYLKLPRGKYNINFKQKDDYPRHISITGKSIRIKYILPLLIIITLLLLYFYRHKIGWKFILTLFFLIIIILGSELFDNDFIFGIFIFAFYIYDNLFGDNEEDEDDE